VSIEAFILVGGRSSRFGSDKAIAELNGQSILERMASAVRTALPGSRIRLVAANDSQFSGTATLAMSLPTVFDLHEGRGPIGGLQTALSYAESEWVLALACDQPLLSAELIDRLASMIADHLDAIVPVQPDGRMQPLCALYRTKPCLKVIDELLKPNQPAPPLRAIFEQVRTREVPFEEISDLPGCEHFFLNMNTPDDLQRAIRLARA
jgi:molybdopterin-guanine dinucleotide biosynthesis protein A